jgi:drug/metabolite transporter (DMT)-like permease
MAKLVLWGIISSLFFSSTFILNRIMTVGGGHWAWTSSLRYFYAIIILSTVVLLKSRKGYSLALQEFKRNWKFWIFIGSVGFGVFYSCLCYAFAYAEGWMVASIWQTTIIASLVIIRILGQKVRWKSVTISSLIFAGVVLLNIGRLSTVPVTVILKSSIPVIVAAFAYPLGNMLLNKAKEGKIESAKLNKAVVEDDFSRVFLMTLGSLPFWLIFLLVVSPPPPTHGQLIKTFIVALLAGTLGTVAFLRALHRSKTAHEKAAVNATQGVQAVFVLLGEILFLKIPIPGILGIIGMSCIVIGTVFYAKEESKK